CARYEAGGTKIDSW
nr:immunoglobulin heavy chain junction region [Macaca mulatta]